MKSKIEETKQRRVFLKIYPNFQLIKKAGKILKENIENNLQVSILGKLPKKNLKNNKELITAEDAIITNYKAIFKTPINYGIISNSEIGNIYIVGSFTPMFLQEINGKKIGSMPTGPYSILRGLGIDNEKVNTYLNALKNGNYLLILRGYKNKLEQLEDRLMNLS